MTPTIVAVRFHFPWTPHIFVRKYLLGIPRPVTYIYADICDCVLYMPWEIPSVRMLN